MAKLSIFLFFWGLTTFAINRADILGIILAVFGFLCLFTIVEDLEDNERY